jgi:hypothetical protein
MQTLSPWLDLDMVELSIQFSMSLPVKSVCNLFEMVTERRIVHVYDMATTKVKYPNQSYRIKHYGQYDINSDEYAEAEFYIDHGLGVETKLGDLSSTIKIAAISMIVVRAYYIARCGCDNELYRIFRTKCTVSFGGATQNSTLMQCLTRFIACHTIAATTDAWDKILATSVHSEYVVRSGTECGIREADFCNVNLTNASVGGYMTMTTTATT